MKRFTRLYTALDETNRTNEKVALLTDYFRTAPPEDAAWALYFLTGRRLGRAISTTNLRQWVADFTGLPLWLVEESYHAVGDLAETLALLLPPTAAGDDIPLHQLVEAQIRPLAKLNAAAQQQAIQAVWQALSPRARFVYHKLITGSFRVGVGRTLVIRALAQAAEIDPAIMAHRLMGHWEPTIADYTQLIARTADQTPDQAGGETTAQTTDHRRPYPFYLAYPLDGEPAGLGPRTEWQVEWKWDGIRAQIIHRQGDILVWTRGEELVTDVYPEIAEVATALPTGTVLDGEILAWRNDAPLPFTQLQLRIGRKRLTPAVLRDAPVVLMAYDLLEDAGGDIRTEPLHARRARLAEIVAQLPPTLSIRLSTPLTAPSWPALSELHPTARSHQAEGFMLKRLDSAYGVGRVKGDWWKWKVDPFTVDAVLIYAQAGHGRRAGLFTDYTFAVWDGDELVPVAKAYSGLTDAEIRQVDAFVRSNTTERFGPVRAVKPELVFELAFEGIQPSKRHKSGIALRFPRMHRWRHDKSPQEADTLQTLTTLLADLQEN
jgi:DNA ligase-1